MTNNQDTFFSPKNIREPKSFPSFSVPKIIGSFSLDANRSYISDARNCKYLRKPNQSPLHLDLNEGYEHAVHKTNHSDDEKLDHILRFILKNKSNLEDSIVFPQDTKANIQHKKINVDFVCYRGLLRIIMCTPYENRDPWIILASKFKGTIYLCALETEHKKLERVSATDNTKRILSYGYKFEQYMLTGKFYGLYTKNANDTNFKYVIHSYILLFAR